ncbi:MAG: class I SAM-dependent methyltransferase [Egibacteraceae bacterium]
MIDLFALNGRQRLLDLASGSCTLLKRLRARTTAMPNYVAADMSFAMLRAAPDDGSRDVARVQCDAVRLPFKDDCFDRVACGFALTMFSSAPKAIAEVHRVLRPGGVVAFSSVSAARDVLWAWQDDLLCRHGVEVPRVETRRFRHAHDYVAALSGRLSEVRVREYFAPLHFKDVDEWMRWCASHGGRAFLQDVPAGRRGAFLQDLAVALERYSSRTGIHLVLPALIAVARK